MMKQRVSVSWSGGKDSAFALYKILLSGDYDVVSLHTVVNKDNKRVGLHGIKEELINLQAKELSLPLEILHLQTSADHGNYERLLKNYYHNCKRKGAEGIVFGDIFLEDLRTYREELMKESGLFPVFPLWKIDTNFLIHDFINAGFKTLLCSVNAALFDKDVAGRTIDSAFIDILPANVDPCGENGEFHTFVYDGPIFKKCIQIIRGEVVRRDYSYQKKLADGSTENLTSGFWFQDLTPVDLSLTY